MAIMLRIAVTVEVTDRKRRTPAAHLARALGITTVTLHRLAERAGVDGDRLLELQPAALTRLLSVWSRSHSGAKRLAVLVGDALSDESGQADSSSTPIAGRAVTYAEMRAALHQHIRADQRDAPSSPAAPAAHPPGGSAEAKPDTMTQGE